MIFLIRLIQNAVSIYSIILVAFALLSWFPNAYESQLGRLVIRLARPVIEPLRKLNLQFPLHLHIFLDSEHQLSLSHLNDGFALPILADAHEDE